MRPFLAAIVLLTASQALAVEVPKFDVDEICRANLDRRTSKFGPFEERYNRCIDDQQAKFDAIKALWPGLDPEEQATCLDKNPGVYANILVCAELRTREHERNRERREQDEVIRRIPKRELRD